MHRSPLPGIRRAVLGAFVVSLVSTVSAQAPRNPQEPRNLLGNASFENPPVDAGSSARLASAGAWTAVEGALEIENHVGDRTPFTGDQHLELASLAAVRQVCNTRAGQRYSLCFSYCERLLASPTLSSKTGTSPWLGPGNPAPVVFQIPASASLVGRTLFVQGRMLDASAGAPIPTALADGFALTLQP